MKAILEFNLPKEYSKFSKFNKAEEYHSFICDLDQELRSVIKHGHDYASVEELADKIRGDINKLRIYD